MLLNEVVVKVDKEGIKRCTLLGYLGYIMVDPRLKAVKIGMIGEVSTRE